MRIEVTVDSVVKKYIELRTEVARIEADMKAQTNVIKENMEKLESWIRLRAEAEGVTSFKTPHGTCFFTSTDFAHLSDPSIFFKFVIDNQFWDLVEKRCAKLAIRSYISEHKEVPPGVSYGTKLEINFRRPTTPKEQ